MEISKRDRGQVLAGAAAGRQVDDLRLVVAGPRSSWTTRSDSRMPPPPTPLIAKPSTKILGRRSDAADDAGDEGAVAGVRSQVGAVDLVVAVDALEPRRPRVGRGGRVPSRVDDDDADPALARCWSHSGGHGSVSPVSSGSIAGHMVPPPPPGATCTQWSGVAAPRAKSGRPRGGRAPRAPTGRRGARAAGSARAPSSSWTSSRRGRAVEDPLAELRHGALERLDVLGAHEDVVGVEEVGEVGRGLGVPGHPAVVGLAKRVELVGGASSVGRRRSSSRLHGPTLAAPGLGREGFG